MEYDNGNSENSWIFTTSCSVHFICTLDGQLASIAAHQLVQAVQARLYRLDGHFLGRHSASLRGSAASRPIDVVLDELIGLQFNIMRPLLLHQLLAVLHVEVVLNPVLEGRFEQLLHVELLAVKIAHVIVLGAHFQVRDQVLKLLVLRVLLERGNRNAIA